MKRIVLGIIAVVVVLVLVAFIVTWFTAPQLTTTTSNSSTTGVITTSTSVPPEITEHEQYYDIDAKEPSTTPLAQSVGQSANSAAVNLMANYVATLIDQFKTQGDFGNLTAQDKQQYGFDTGRKESLIVNYQMYSSQHAVSYVFEADEDTLGAHPNVLYQTFTFDTTTGAPLALGDLFNQNVDYLGALSSACRSGLAALLGSNADTNQIAAGTVPSQQNFQYFAFDGSNIDIIFPPYQVAPFALGTQTVKIPLTQLAGLLKTQYQ